MLWSRTRRSILVCFVVLGSAGLVVDPAAAMPQTSAPASAGSEQALSRQYAGLSLMNDTIGSTLPQASQREKLLSGYIQTKSLDGDFASYAAPAFNAGATFEQALDAAIKQAALSPPMQGSSETLAAEVAAQTQLVRGSWDELQGLRQKNWAMTSFIRSKNLFDDYHDWAVQESADLAAKAKADQAARMAKASAEEKARAEQAAAATHMLQEEWDKIPYASPGSGSGYKPSQNSNTTTTGSQENNSSDSGDSYWNGSYYDGYADPYYDVWGVPAEVGVRGWEAYRRAHGRGTGTFHSSGGSTISAPRPARGFRR